MRLALAAVLACLVMPAAAPAAESPETDPFYVAPAGLAGAAPGAILRTREVQIDIGPLPAGLLTTAYQLLYRTNDAHGRPVAAVTTVEVPSGAAPAGGRDLVSLQDATDSLDITCAPSYQLQIGSPDNNNLTVESPLIVSSLVAGRTVVIPDHEGPDSEYLVKKMEGHAVLDGLRAAEAFAPAQLAGRTTRIALTGYSGGAHASASAGELQPAYAPELDIVAVAAGGVPVGNRGTFEGIEGLGTGAIIGVSIAIDRAFPNFRLLSLLNDRGKAFVAQYTKGCASAVLAAPGTKLDDFTNEPDLLGVPRVARIIARNALGHATPTAPTFFYNGIGDELIKIGPVDALVAEYCAEGAQVQYVRDPAGLEHIQGLANFTPLAIAYMSDRFAGAAVPDDCGPPAAAPATCTGAVRLRVHVKRGVRVRRITVRSGGKVVGLVRHRARRVRVMAAGPTARVTVRVVGRRHGKRVRITRHRTVRVCRPGS